MAGQLARDDLPPLCERLLSAPLRQRIVPRGFRERRAVRRAIVAGLRRPDRDSRVLPTPTQAATARPTKRAEKAAAQDRSLRGQLRRGRYVHLWATSARWRYALSSFLIM